MKVYDDDDDDDDDDEDDDDVSYCSATDNKWSFKPILFFSSLQPSLNYISRGFLSHAVASCPILADKVTLCVQTAISRVSLVFTSPLPSACVILLAEWHVFCPGSR